MSFDSEKFFPSKLFQCMLLLERYQSNIMAILEQYVHERVKVILPYQRELFHWEHFIEKSTLKKCHRPHFALLSNAKVGII